jgi:site-specific DNA-cytosine methylase
MIKLLIGGSPCTYWSVAQTKNREVKAEGTGWELFRNFLIAKEKFKPDFFLYENNKSASQPIKEQISKELGVELMYINSALVSAQNRERFYAFNWHIEQPQDRHIILADILEHGCPWNDKAYCLTASYAGATLDNTIHRHQRTMVAEPVKENKIIRVGTFGSSSQTNRIHSIYGKSPCVCTGVGAYIAYSAADGEAYPVYQVKNGTIQVKDKICPIKLNDGFYIIRKLTPIECERLQTLPDNYTAGISKTQRYRCLGNGWTAEVIIHILSALCERIPKKEKLLVLSMYDGIATGRYCLDRLGFTNVEYHAYEIDKYAITVATNRYPAIHQHGDAFQVRNENWHL